MYQVSQAKLDTRPKLEVFVTAAWFMFFPPAYRLSFALLVNTKPLSCTVEEA